ncbi:MAG: cytochrome oxidase assembly [Bryobacterales bacterium]|nr:cytochrome oxidase assembly [Bryobacterales bacterium]
MQTPWLHRYATLVAVCTLFLVVAGASVTSKEAGLSVPDWPLSYGQVIPQMTGGVLFETGHRMIATVVGILTIILAIWIARVEKRAWMRRLGWLALGGVVAQGLLGGATVLLLQPAPISVAHACLAQLFFSVTVAIAVFTSRKWQQGPEPVEDYGWPSLRSLAILTPVLVLAQIGLGAGFRHRAFGLLPHVIGAMIVPLVILLVSAFVLHQFPKHRALRPAAVGLLAITLVQIFLGIAAYFARLQAAEYPLAMVLTTVAHVATGGLTLAASVVLAIQIRRNVRAAVSVESAETSQVTVTS